MVKSAQFIAHPTFAVPAASQLQTQMLPRPTPNVKSFSIVMPTEDLGPDQDLGPLATGGGTPHLLHCKMAAEFDEIMVQRMRGAGW